MKLILRIVVVIALFYALAVGLLYVMQRQLVFSASTDRVQPELVGLSGIQEVSIRNSAEEQLYSWYAAADPGKATILYLHGNGGSVSTRHSVQQRFIERGLGILVAGYPGYGGSEGSPSEDGLIEAAQLAHNHLRQAGVDPEQIVLFGESLGSSVAIQLATTVTAKALILAAPMYSIREIAQSQYPYVPISFLLKDPFLSFEHIASVTEPILIFHGSIDEAIPPESSRKLFNLANEPKTYRIVDGAGHNNLFDFEVIDMMEDFLKTTSNDTKSGFTKKY